MERLTQCIDGKVDTMYRWKGWPRPIQYCVFGDRVTRDADVGVTLCNIMGQAVCWGGVIIWSINTASNEFCECVRGSISFLDLDNETICILGSLQSVSVQGTAVCADWEEHGNPPATFPSLTGRVSVCGLRPVKTDQTNTKWPFHHTNSDLLNDKHNLDILRFSLR